MLSPRQVVIVSLLCLIAATVAIAARGTTAGPADRDANHRLLPDPAPPTDPPPGTPPGTAEGIYYDIVYSRAPRAGDDENTKWPEVKNPIRVEAGTDLVLLRPDGSEEVLVEGGHGAVVDPFVSFDGDWVFYAQFHDLRGSPRGGRVASGGADLYKLHLPSRRVVRLTHQEWTPNSVPAGGSRGRAQRPRPDHGVFNLGPTPLPGGRIMFTSSRNGFLPNKSFTYPNLQLYVMDEDASNVELVGHLNLGSALHPTILHDGRVMFSSYETQGLRDKRLWGLWSIWPDGRYWQPLLSAFERPASFHFQTQTSDGRIVVVDYYNQNNNGFGTLVSFPSQPDPTRPPFGKANARDSSNPPLAMGRFGNGKVRYDAYPFSPQGLEVVTPFAHGEDNAAARDDTGVPMGKVTHPAGAPHNDLLLVWSPGPVNSKKRPSPKPYYDGGIYLLKGGRRAEHPSDLVEIKNDPAYNEMQPRPVVPYRDVYGLDEPFELTWLPNDGGRNAALPAGTPFGLVGTSSFYRRATAPGQGLGAYAGLDAFNSSRNGGSSNWESQGADAGRYDSADIWAVRIVSMEPTSDQAGAAAGRRHFHNHARERLRILGEIPLRKTDDEGNEILDPEGNPDTSFLARIPADTPFTFHTLDRDGLVLNSSQTWHQLRPGEVRADCGGCHAHDQLPLEFESTAAAGPDYEVWDLTSATPLISRDEEGRPTVRSSPDHVVDVEFYRDIRPILERSCISCHTSEADEPPGKLVLDDRTLHERLPGDYRRLADHAGGKWGHPAVTKKRTYAAPNASRYVRKFQSRRSLLAWKLFGRRLDGWENEDHPTELSPGDPETLPAGADPERADLDYDGVPCPPPQSDTPPLSADEKILFGRWIDLGAPIDVGRTTGHAKLGWFLDDLRPTLVLSQPRPGPNDEPLAVIRIGAFDAYSGLDAGSLSVKASFQVNGKRPGTELASQLVPSGDHIWTLPLAEPLSGVGAASLNVSVRDRQGNLTRIDRSFSVR